MNECAICMHLKPAFVVPICSDMHKVCRECSRYLRACPFCRGDWKLSNIENLHPRNPRDIETYDSIPMDIHSYVYKHIKTIGISLDIQPSDGIRYRIDPIHTSIELEDMKLNLLQYAILEDGYENHYQWRLTSRYMYEEAYRSLIDGIDRDIDPYDLYKIENIEKMSHKDLCNQTLDVSSRIYSYLKTHPLKRSTYHDIYNSTRDNDKKMVSDSLQYLIIRKLIIKEGNMYVYVI